MRARLLADPRARPLGGRKADLFTLPGFIGADRCRELVAIIEERATPSPLFNDSPTGRKGIRTSSTHYFRDDPRALLLGEQIDALLGLDRANAEPMQGQRYCLGEEYRVHRDHFLEDREHWQRERLRGGQRSWTAMIYLNEVEAGGTTDFPDLGLSIRPETGMLLAWNNMDRRGRPNKATRHGGRPVEVGSKYIVTQWYRLEAHNWGPE
ncbi:2OG-Fe(II) oxygenase [Altererythrobacter salegens]|uniref:2OG-Fe(II) oxygenase n=1 Tax=Croceibacterium salegens TaxID=1737568 RepID=A0A6I4ST13_9SPHN|nr:2OG-Fe(II) oxygenase [Croceibacterium salegens]MXO59043.1 2OG-Fe(II) oxygenase [Croceibacterium salegens]